MSEADFPRFVMALASCLWKAHGSNIETRDM